MTESFLVLLAGGVMLAAFISDPREVTVNWLRLAGIIALAMTALAAYFFSRRGPTPQKERGFFRMLFLGRFFSDGGGFLFPFAGVGSPSPLCDFFCGRTTEL